jgi:hypothetical protein
MDPVDPARNLGDCAPFPPSSHHKDAMKTRRRFLSRIRWVHASIFTLAAAACGGGEPAPEPADSQDAATAEETMEERRVEIVEPADGAVLEAGPMLVRLEAHGFTVVPAGDTTPNSGHHHLFLDRDVSPAGEPIPQEEGHIIHLGTGVSEYAFEAVEPGEHRLIAVVGDAIHVPVDPPLVDTVQITVE